MPILGVPSYSEELCSTLSMFYLLIVPTHFKGILPRFIEPGTSSSFRLTGDYGAILITKSPTHVEDAALEGSFMRYTKHYYESWVGFANEMGHGNDIQPILVSGFDKTRESAQLAYSYQGTPHMAEFTTAESTTAVSGSTWGVWKTKGFAHHNSCGQ